LLPHVWQKRGIGKEMHLVSNADAAICAKAIVGKPERRCQDKMRGPSLPLARAAWIPHPLRSRLQFSILPAILDLGRTCDNAPHIAEG